MSASITQYTLAAPFSLATPDDTLPTTLRLVRMAVHDETLTHVQLTVQAEWDIYQHLRVQELAHLTAPALGDAADDVLEPKQPVFVDLALAPDLFSHIPQERQDASSLATHLAALEHTPTADPLLATESWYVLSVWQPIALSGELTGNELRVGYSTVWAKVYTPDRPPDAEPTGPIFEAVTRYFTAEGWSFERLADASILRLEFRGGHGDWYCFAQVREQESQFAFYSFCPIVAPEEDRYAVAEFLMRANFGMIIGNFEMDFDDGEIRYKTSIDVEGSELTPALIRQLVHANVTMMDRYLPGVVQIIHGVASPTTAIAQIESGA
jgi:hypothetical protein